MAKLPGQWASDPLSKCLGELPAVSVSMFAIDSKFSKEFLHNDQCVEDEDVEAVL